MEVEQAHTNLRLTARGRTATVGATPSSVTATHAKFEIIRLEQKEPVPASRLTLLISVVSFANILGYVAGLFVNIAAAIWQGQSPFRLTIPLLWAFSQVLEHSSIITESMWRFCVAFHRNPVPRPSLRLVGDNVPGVVIVVVACGEPDDVVIDTIKAACHVDYPVGKLKIILADDGHSSVLEQQVAVLQTRYPFIHYTSRTMNIGYKAGNLNVCLRSFVPPLGFAYDWICVLDADMMPEREILRALLPHGVVDDEVGMVTTGQHFYNIPPNDPLYQSNITGTHAEDGARDSVGTAWCPGSGFLLRRSAWVDIGGFPEYAITEDLFTSWHLHGKAWKTVLVHEVLQWGIQPDCFVVHMKQRRRWWTGHLSKVMTTQLSLQDPMLDAATFVQRYAMFQHCLRPFNNTIFKAGSLLLTVFCVACGGKVIAVPSERAVFTIFFSVFLQRLIARFNDLKVLPEIDKLWNMRRRQATNAWLGLHFSQDTLKAALPTLLPGKTNITPLGFQVSGVKELECNSARERSAAERPGPFRRLKVFNDREGILWYPLVAATIMLIVHIKYHQLKSSGKDHDEFWTELVCSIGFPGLGLIELVPLLFTPVLYGLFPPTMPPRRELMYWDEQKEMWWPKDQAKKMKWTAATSLWLEVPHLIAFAWLCVVLGSRPWSFVA